MDISKICINEHENHGQISLAAKVVRKKTTGKKVTTQIDNRNKYIHIDAVLDDRRKREKNVRCGKKRQIKLHTFDAIR